jgi:hypothetical protein
MQCIFVSAGDPFETFNLATTFPRDAPTELAGNVSASIVRLQVMHCDDTATEISCC